MKNSSYRTILYFIGIVIFITLGIQIYWNYRNYQAGKQQLLNEVQISLDNAVEDYYASIAQRNTRVSLPGSAFLAHGQLTGTSSIPSKLTYGDSTSHLQGNSDGRKFVVANHDTTKLKELASYKPTKIYGSTELLDLENVTILKTDTTYKDLEKMVGKIIFSLGKDTLDLKRMEGLLRSQLERKDIAVDFGLIFRKQDEKIEQKSNQEILDKSFLRTNSKSPWLPIHSTLSVQFTNGTATILKENLFGMLLSAILLTAVIGCLLFLLKIINNQKQLAEIKNDFISNLTHEFKTPIATIKVGLEGILYFNKDNDPEKTAKYLKTSTDQIEKLNTMVEKLLEVATLNSSQLQLEKKNVELVSVLRTLFEKYKVMASEKSFIFSSQPDEIHLAADPFHLENAFNNIIDNAAKYGGKKITISLSGKNEEVEIIISDTGNTLTKSQAAQVFDQFYRVPKGNTHDVKGFGIGLFYTKQIIERHGGSINVEIGEKTNFIITLPYD